MCRFLLAKSPKPIEAQSILTPFADMAEKSRSPDGDTQGDGWGASWYTEKGWEGYTSLLPIWEDTAAFARIPTTTLLMIHARSASFVKDKGDVKYNQPYILNPHAFVFNGLLKGISYPLPLIGSIGAQKIWSLVQGELLNTQDTSRAVEEAVTKLIRHTKHVQALNLGVSDGQSFSVYSQFSQNPEYYALQLHTSHDLTIVSSEPIVGYAFSPLPTARIHTFV